MRCSPSPSRESPSAPWTTRPARSRTCSTSASWRATRNPQVSNHRPVNAATNRAPMALRDSCQRIATVTQCCVTRTCMKSQSVGARGTPPVASPNVGIAPLASRVRRHVSRFRGRFTCVHPEEIAVDVRDESTSISGSSRERPSTALRAISQRCGLLTRGHCFANTLLFRSR
jgi:hypothetical protein